MSNITTEQLFEHARTHSGLLAEPSPQDGLGGRPEPIDEACRIA